MKKILRFKMKNKKYLTLLVVLVCGMSQAVWADDKKTSQSVAKNALNGFLDFNGYYATGNSEILTLNLQANLPYRFQYFSLNDFFQPQNRNDSGEVHTFLSEQNLRWGLPKNIPVDLTFQWFMTSGLDNDRARFGARWRLSSTPWLEKFFKMIHMFYSVNFHVLETDFTHSIESWQIEYVYQIKILPTLLKERVYLRGFADHNMRYGSQATAGNNHIWVTEHQVGIRAVNWLYVVAEYRYNEFFASKRNDVGIGLEYQINF